MLCIPFPYQQLTSLTLPFDASKTITYFHIIHSVFHVRHRFVFVFRRGDTKPYFFHFSQHKNNMPDKNTFARRFDNHT